VGDRLQDQPFFYNVYALKREAKAMKPAAGALIWTRSRQALAGDHGGRADRGEAVRVNHACAREREHQEEDGK
jgi:hypothetical protein